MKRLINIDKKLDHPESEATQEMKDALASFRTILRLVCISVVTKDIEELDNLDQARMALSTKEADLLMEDAHFLAIKKQVQQNPLNWPAWIFSAVLNYLRESEKNKVEIKIEEAK